MKGARIYELKRWLRDHSLSDDWLPWTVAFGMIVAIAVKAL